MFSMKNLSIRVKLLLIFIFFKIIPLLILAGISIYGFIEIKKLFKDNASHINRFTQRHLAEIADLSISDAIKSLDKKSQQIMEKESVALANNIANFLKYRDEDIIELSQNTITQDALEKFYQSKKRAIYTDSKAHYDPILDKWQIDHPPNTSPVAQKQDILVDNQKEFHKAIHHPYHTKVIPLYKEVAFYTPEGQEVYKVSSIDSTLHHISDSYQTYLHAEHYFERAKRLKKGEIYVSRVIGNYVRSPIIGSFTRANAEKEGIPFQPEKYAYAGIENPVGKKFSGIIRYITPVYQGKTLKGYLSMALDHAHIMNFTDYYNPLGTDMLAIPDAGSGNYAFMWDNYFRCISHPRDYFIIGFDAKTGEEIPGWVDASLADAFKKTQQKDLKTFLAKQPYFDRQTLKKKPYLGQKRRGEIGLDCKYLNFAPQCQGWRSLVNDGGYGSFIIYWSGVWKLTTAAAIPYYTGDYNQSKIGFGFVTLGANIDRFHDAAIATSKKIATIVEGQNDKIQTTIKEISSTVLDFIQKQLNYMELFTLILLILAVYVAILFSNYISKRVDEIIRGTKMFRETQFEHRMEITKNDELGKITIAFNDMAESITLLQHNLYEQIHRDELTGLKNKAKYNQDVKILKAPLLYLVDIDFFRNINNFYGIASGDYILQRVGHILDSFAIAHAMKCYRFGSDEFLLLEDSTFNYSTVERNALRLRDIMMQSRIISEKYDLDINLNISIGIAYGTENLIQKADLALSEAKRKKNVYRIYDPYNPHMNSFKENVVWRRKIQYAIENDKVVPYYQPIIDLKNPNYKKYEVLMRIVDNEEVIPPSFFLHIAKETKQYHELSKIIIKKSFLAFSKNDYDLSINLSITDIEEAQTVSFMKQQMEKYQLGNRLTIELLETEEIKNKDMVLDFIRSMSNRGVKIAIDDFGSGYSNFSYLLQMNPDIIKIDGDIIKHLTEHSNEFYIVEAIIKFATMLHIKTVAEHVSSQEILTILKKLKVDYYQGYLFSEPKPEL